MIDISVQILIQLLLFVFFTRVDGASSSEQPLVATGMEDGQPSIPDIPTRKIMFQQAANLDLLQTVYLTSDEKVYLGTPYYHEVPHFIDQMDILSLMTNCEGILPLAFKEYLHNKESGRNEYLLDFNLSLLSLGDFCVLMTASTAESKIWMVYAVFRTVIQILSTLEEKNFYLMRSFKLNSHVFIDPISRKIYLNILPSITMSRKRGHNMSEKLEELLNMFKPYFESYHELRTLSFWLHLYGNGKYDKLDFLRNIKSQKTSIIALNLRSAFQPNRRGFTLIPINLRISFNLAAVLPISLPMVDFCIVRSINPTNPLWNSLLPQADFFEYKMMRIKISNQPYLSSRVEETIDRVSAQFEQFTLSMSMSNVGFLFFDPADRDEKKVTILVPIERINLNGPFLSDLIPLNGYYNGFAYTWSIVSAMADHHLTFESAYGSIRPSNIVIVDISPLKFCKFNPLTVKPVYVPQIYASMAFTPSNIYLAPEILCNIVSGKEGISSIPADIWALGICILHMLGGTAVFVKSTDLTSNPSYTNLVFRNQVYNQMVILPFQYYLIIELPKHSYIKPDPRVLAVMRVCLIVDPDARSNLSQIIHILGSRIPTHHN